MKEEIFYLFRCTSWWQEDAKPLICLLCYLKKKREMKIRFLEHKKDHAGFATCFNGGRKRLLPKSFKRTFSERYWIFQGVCPDEQKPFLVKKLWNHLFKEDTKMNNSIISDEKVSLFCDILQRENLFAY